MILLNRLSDFYDGSQIIQFIFLARQQPAHLTKTKKNKFTSGCASSMKADEKPGDFSCFAMKAFTNKENK